MTEDRAAQQIMLLLKKTNKKKTWQLILQITAIKGPWHKLTTKLHIYCLMTTLPAHGSTASYSNQMLITSSPHVSLNEKGSFYLPRSMMHYNCNKVVETALW